MRRSYIAPAVCALLSLTVTVTACGTDYARTAAGAKPRTSAASTATTPPPTRTTTATPPTPATESITLPKVLADCTSPPPQKLSVRPASITLACADAGWGVEDMAWNSWTALPRHP